MQENKTVSNTHFGQLYMGTANYQQHFAVYSFETKQSEGTAPPPPRLREFARCGIIIQSI